MLFKIVKAAALLGSLVCLAPASAIALPVCENAASDSDGDGFGWEKGASCIVDSTTPSTQVVRSFGRPTVVCSSSASDSNGDGFGWENGASCIVASTTSTQVVRSSGRPTVVCSSSASDSNGDGFGWESGASCIVDSTTTSAQVVRSSGRPTLVCSSSSSDSNGDGYGWENGASCIVNSTATSTTPVVRSSRRPTTICRSSTSDSNGDGFGWENGASCVVSSTDTQPATMSLTLPLAEERVVLRVPACSDRRFDPDGDGFGWENSTSCTFRNAGDGGRSITDVVLVTGQSNALGAETSELDPNSYVPALDSPVERVYAYSENGWGIAGLHQIWDRGWYPRTDISGQPANNFAFHFGKSLVRYQPDTVVGIILITAPGAGIDRWNPAGDFFGEIDTRVRRALDSLPGNPKVRGVLWHQGESDFYSTDLYSQRLRQLIGNIRGRDWFANDGVFVCGETLNSPVNERLSALNNDGDSRTACASSNGLTSVGDEIHFNASSLRTLGARYAERYRSISR